MFNFSWGVVFVLLNLALFLACYYFFGKTGLFAWISAATVLANIQVIKSIEIFGIAMTLGNTMYGTIYLSTDLLNEKYGEKEAKKAVWFGFFMLVTMTLIMQAVLKFQPSSADVGQDSLQVIFGIMPRLALASLCAYFSSQFLDVQLFSMLKKRFPKPNQLWIRNNGSTLVSQFLDTFIFCVIAFYSMYPWHIWCEILLSTYILKGLISIGSTPILYLACRLPK